MGHLYAGLAEFKAYLSGGDVGTARDSTMLVVLESAARAVDSFCRRGEGFAADLADLVASGTLAADASDSDTTVTVADGTLYTEGQTVKVDDEEILVVSITDDSLLVVRAQHGTAAAAHANGSTVNAFRYPTQVVAATLMVAQRRWKMRDSGLTGSFGGGDIPQTSNHDTEWSILKAAIGHLRLMVFA